jgi:hypothetical protein
VNGRVCANGASAPETSRTAPVTLIRLFRF